MAYIRTTIGSKTKTKIFTTFLKSFTKSHYWGLESICFEKNTHSKHNLRSPTPLGDLNPLIDAVFVLLDDSHRLSIQALTFLIMKLEELMESSSNNVLLLQFLAESNVIQCVTVTLSSKESEASNLLNSANTTHRLGCRSLLNYLSSNCFVAC